MEGEEIRDRAIFVWLVVSYSQLSKGLNRLTLGNFHDSWQAFAGLFSCNFHNLDRASLFWVVPWDQPRA